MPDYRVITLPPGDDDFSNRIKAMKIHFVQALPSTEGRSSVRMAKGERGVSASGRRSETRRAWPTTILSERRARVRANSFAEVGAVQ